MDFLRAKVGFVIFVKTCFFRRVQPTQVFNLGASWLKVILWTLKILVIHRFTDTSSGLFELGVLHRPGQRVSMCWEWEVKGIELGLGNICVFLDYYFLFSLGGSCNFVVVKEIVSKLDRSQLYPVLCVKMHLLSLLVI